ncbi:DUF402 domain-containing protein [Corynebacterium epidermidicanis]|uniref:DUF402 domain-containing protein n=1 Tax=Corynebacterium epidermidicanis TaxID=1050174 RepID=A0A0G3GNJ6_9CORY|nr:DUF402 domain-containing protein [Corynebacterium epidermidicanis]AKK02801.1 hypothetical protein CEPID_04655 [Corynebacterium epidermidicanis]
MTEVHHVKTETFHLDTAINIDPKGFERQVDTFTVTDFGLYMARGADHPKFGYLESWLLPELSLRANIFHFRPGEEKHQHFYFDVASITVDGDIWTTRDFYVDLVSFTGEPVEVVDIDELAAATSAGLITAEQAEKAIETTLLAVEGITRAGDDAMAWLASKGYPLTWADQIQLQPAATQ